MLKRYMEMSTGFLRTLELWTLKLKEGSYIKAPSSMNPWKVLQLFLNKQDVNCRETL